MPTQAQEKKSVLAPLSPQFNCHKKRAAPETTIAYDKKTVAILLFAGPCVLEYQENYSNGKITVTLATQFISSYVKQPSFVGPVTLAFNGQPSPNDNPNLSS